MKIWEETFKTWCNATDIDPHVNNDLEAMKGNDRAIKEAFHQDLVFGTGGIRGVLGAGTNRMNIYTVRRTIYGLAKYIKKNIPSYQSRGVVVGYDSRYMSDAFSREVAKTLGMHGIKTYLYDDIRPVPLVSFGVRHLQAAAGVMITASHNPPEYNGIKVYNETGSQLTLKEADNVLTEVNASPDALDIPVKEVLDLKASGLLEWIGPKVDQAYLRKLGQITKQSDPMRLKPKDLKLVYTPLHGTGLALIQKGLAQLGFKHVEIVEEQAILDPDFSTVTSPNPEEAQAFTYAIKQGIKSDADILLATDPDADRLGVAVRQRAGDYTLLTGNQLGVLLLDYILQHTDDRTLKVGRFITTIVSTPMSHAIAESYGVKAVQTLTGFKFMTEKIQAYENTEKQFLFGFEESYGYLIDEFVRDKDAVQAAVMTSEMAAFYKAQGKTLIDVLTTLYETYGYYVEDIIQVTLKGLDGAARIKDIMNQLRTDPPKAVAGLNIDVIEDYFTQKRLINAEQDEQDMKQLPRENVLKFYLENNVWVCFRPSGTEPKLKCYFGVRHSEKTQAHKHLALLKTALVDLIKNIQERI